MVALLLQHGECEFVSVHVWLHFASCLKLCFGLADGLPVDTPQRLVDILQSLHRPKYLFYPNPVLVQANYLSDWPVQLLHLLWLAKTSNTFDIKHLQLSIKILCSLCWGIYGIQLIYVSGPLRSSLDLLQGNITSKQVPVQDIKSRSFIPQICRCIKVHNQCYL